MMTHLLHISNDAWLRMNTTTGKPTKALDFHIPTFMTICWLWNRGSEVILVRIRSNMNVLADWCLKILFLVADESSRNLMPLLALVVLPFFIVAIVCRICCHTAPNNPPSTGKPCCKMLWSPTLVRISVSRSQGIVLVISYPPCQKDS